MQMLLTTLYYNTLFYSCTPWNDRHIKGEVLRPLPAVPYSFSLSSLDIKYAAAQPAVAAAMLQMSSDVLLNDTGIMGTVEAITKPIMQ